MSAPPDAEVMLRRAMRLFVLKPTAAARHEGLRSLAKLPPFVLDRWNQPAEVSPVNGWTVLFDVMTAKEAEETSFREGGQVDAVQALLDAGIAVTMALPAFLAQPAFRSTNPYHEQLFRFLLERTAEHAHANGRVVVPLLRHCALPARCPDETWRKAIQRTCDHPTPQFAAQIAAAEAKHAKREARKRKAEAAAKAEAEADNDEDESSDSSADDCDEAVIPTKKKLKGHKKSSDGGAAAEEKDSDTAELRAAIRSLIVPSLQVPWDAVGGLQQAKAILKETVLLPILQPQLFTGKLSAWKGILFYGPPGTGQPFAERTTRPHWYFLQLTPFVSRWVVI